VALLRALATEPRLLLLDEPLAALDVKLRVELRAMVRELQLESGITTVFVTHDQEEALALSDVIAVMDRGRIVQMGAPREIYASPANEYVADFMGSANVIEAVGGMRKGVRSGAIQLGEGDMRGVVEHVEFRGSVTGYRIRTELGVLHVDVWNSDRVWDRGDEVSFRLPPSASTP
jgi:iron(III) transport system ATP-binding protein